VDSLQMRGVPETDAFDVGRPFGIAEIG
jgi:hypothetical protein